jgi:hypothetical protein
VTAAEALWRGKGCPSGCDYDIWLEAERDLRHPGNGRDGAAFANPQPLLGQRGDDLMTELNERFPGPTGKETTSL